MTMVKDEWLREAMKNDGLVAELLVGFKQEPAQTAATAKLSEVIPLRWGIRLPRSKPGATVPSFRCNVVSKRKDGDSSNRCSPTTPLSWSSGGGGDAYPSATDDGFEETSRHDNKRSPSVPRSKGGTPTGEITGTATKRSRKKKTFAELKEEEILLVKEKIDLEKELTNLRATFKEERARNEAMKRMKIEWNSHCVKNSNIASLELEKAICSQSHQREASSLNHMPSTLPRHAKGDNHQQSDSCQTGRATSNQDRIFLLPDLNEMPSEGKDAETFI